MSPEAEQAVGVERRAWQTALGPGFEGLEPHAAAQHLINMIAQTVQLERQKAARSKYGAGSGSGPGTRNPAPHGYSKRCGRR